MGSQANLFLWGKMRHLFFISVTGDSFSSLDKFVTNEIPNFKEEHG
jgi:hypothetical protein